MTAANNAVDAWKAKMRKIVSEIPSLDRFDPLWSMNQKCSMRLRTLAIRDQQELIYVRVVSQDATPPKFICVCRDHRRMYPLLLDDGECPFEFVTKYYTGGGRAIGEIVQHLTLSEDVVK